MTVPVTGITPAYGIEYLVQGEPAKHTRAKLERNAKAIEAALLARGVPPPAAVDHAALAARVGHLEPDGWVALNLATGAPFASGWPAPRARLEGDVVRLELFVTNVTAGVTIVTLPTHLRPDGNRAIPAVTGVASAALGQVDSAGTVIVGASVAAPGFCLLSGTFTLT